MKKYLVLFLLFCPIVSFAVPSVRMLGSQTATNAATKSEAKITPVRVADTNAMMNSSSRVSSASARTTKASNIKAAAPVASTNSSARFPVITSAHSYNSVSVPQTSGSSATVPADVDIAGIVDTVTAAVTANIERDLYNSAEFKAAVAGAIQNQGTTPMPILDAVRTSNPRTENGGADAPEGYVYMWVEEN